MSAIPLVPVPTKRGDYLVGRTGKRWRVHSVLSAEDLE